MYNTVEKSATVPLRAVNTNLWSECNKDIARKELTRDKEPALGIDESARSYKRRHSNCAAKRYVGPKRLPVNRVGAFKSVNNTIAARHSTNTARQFSEALLWAGSLPVTKGMHSLAICMNGASACKYNSEVRIRYNVVAHKCSASIPDLGTAQ